MCSAAWKLHELEVSLALILRGRLTKLLNEQNSSFAHDLLVDHERGEQRCEIAPEQRKTPTLFAVVIRDPEHQKMKMVHG